MNHLRESKSLKNTGQLTRPTIQNILRLFISVYRIRSHAIIVFQKWALPKHRGEGWIPCVWYNQLRSATPILGLLGDSFHILNLGFWNDHQWYQRALLHHLSSVICLAQTRVLITNICIPPKQTKRELKMNENEWMRKGASEKHRSIYRRWKKKLK